MQHCITSNIALRATLHYIQHCITCNFALRATLYYVQHCITCKIALRARLHYMQHCITFNKVTPIVVSSLAICLIFSFRTWKALWLWSEPDRVKQTLKGVNRPWREEWSPDFICKTFKANDTGHVFGCCLAIMQNSPAEQLIKRSQGVRSLV